MKPAAQLDWIKLCLHKLYVELHLADVSSLGYYWALEWDEGLPEAENRSNCANEVLALNALVNAGVIDASIGDNHLRLRGPEQTKKMSGAPLHYDQLPIITDFNQKAFREYCSSINFNPANDISATVTLMIDYNIPVIMVDGVPHKLDPLKDGSTSSRLALYAYKHEQTIELEEAEKFLNRKIANIAQLYKGGPFTREPLSFFVALTPRSIQVNKSTQLSISQALKIKQIRKK